MVTNEPPPSPPLSTPESPPSGAEAPFLPDPGWPPGREAPGRLERLRRYLNTVNPESGGERFGSLAALGAWLEAEGFPGAGHLVDGDLARAIELRDQLRRAVDDGSGWAALGDLVGPVQLRATARLDALVAVRPGFDEVIAELVTIILAARADGTWQRLGVCRERTCGWAFYDHSRNASSRWCSPAACGGRAKARAYRRRRAATAAAGPSEPVSRSADRPAEPQETGS